MWDAHFGESEYSVRFFVPLQRGGEIYRIHQSYEPSLGIASLPVSLVKC